MDPIEAEFDALMEAVDADLERSNMESVKNRFPLATVAFNRSIRCERDLRVSVAAGVCVGRWRP